MSNGEDHVTLKILLERFARQEGQIGALAGKLDSLARQLQEAEVTRARLIAENEGAHRAFDATDRAQWRRLEALEKDLEGRLADVDRRLRSIEIKVAVYGAGGGAAGAGAIVAIMRALGLL